MTTGSRKNISFQRLCTVGVSDVTVIYTLYTQRTTALRNLSPAEQLPYRWGAPFSDVHESSIRMSHELPTTGRMLFIYQVMTPIDEYLQTHYNTSALSAHSSTASSPTYRSVRVELVCITYTVRVHSVRRQKLACRKSKSCTPISLGCFCATLLCLLVRDDAMVHRRVQRTHFCVYNTN